MRQLRKRKQDYRLALGAKYPRKCTFCLAGIHEGLEDGSLTQEEFDTYMNDPMFPTPTGCERHDYWIAEDEKATVKEATKGIDTFTKPFEESSLDSGTVKKVLVGLGIGALALFGYNKWK